MRSPVERLEEHVGWVEALSVTAPSEQRLAKALREILADYRAMEDRRDSEARHWNPAVSATWEREYDVLDRVIELLANAVNPEETPDE